MSKLNNWTTGSYLEAQIPVLALFVYLLIEGIIEHLFLAFIAVVILTVFHSLINL